VKIWATRPSSLETAQPDSFLTILQETCVQKPTNNRQLAPF